MVFNSNSNKKTHKRKVDKTGEKSLPQVRVQPLEQDQVATAPASQPTAGQPGQAAPTAEPSTGAAEPSTSGYNLRPKKQKWDTESRWVEPVEEVEQGDAVAEDSGQTYEWVLLALLSILTANSELKMIVLGDGGFIINFWNFYHCNV